VRLEEKVVDISRNMALLMENLTNNIRLLREVGCSNLETRSKVKPRDNEDP
jgi:hypothetical protein